jgi:hypothetical protein
MSRWYRSKGYTARVCLYLSISLSCHPVYASDELALSKRRVSLPPFSLFDTSTSEDTKNSEDLSSFNLDPDKRRESDPLLYDHSESEATSKDDSLGAYLDTPRSVSEWQDDPLVDMLIDDLRAQNAALSREVALVASQASNRELSQGQSALKEPADKRRSAPIPVPGSLLRRTFSSAMLSTSGSPQTDGITGAVESPLSPTKSGKDSSPRVRSSRLSERGSASTTPRSRTVSPRSDDSTNSSPRSPLDSPKSASNETLGESPKAGSPRFLDWIKGLSQKNKP